MTRRVERTLLVGALMTVVGTFAVMAIPLSASARLAPLVVALTTLVLLSLELAAALQNGAAALEPSAIEEQNRRERERAAVSWLALLVILLLLMGMVVGLPVYLLLYLRVRAGLRWRSALAFALALGLVLWWGLQVLLRLSPYEGWLRS